MLVGGGALYIVKQVGAGEAGRGVGVPEVPRSSPQTQADFAAGTGYVPIRESSVDLPAIKDLWAQRRRATRWRTTS